VSFNNKKEKHQQKKELLEELTFYRNIILKKLDTREFHSALNKARSALTLLDEHREIYPLDKEIMEFQELYDKVINFIYAFRNNCFSKYHKLISEDLDSTSLERYLRLLDTLKGEIDENVDRYDLLDLKSEIDAYSAYFKRMYAIVNSYKLMSFKDATNEIMRFASEIKDARYPNIRNLLISVYQNLFISELAKVARNVDSISTDGLSNILDVDSKDIKRLLDVVKDQPRSPIKIINNDNIIFNKKI
jgi:hypothetical protein